MTAGFAWLLGLWLVLYEAEPVRRLVERLTDVLAPLQDVYGQAAVIAVTTVVAYLLGSLITGSASSGRLNGLEWLIAYPVWPRFAPLAPWVDQDRLREEDPVLRSIAETRRVRALDLQRLERRYFPQSGYVRDNFYWDRAYGSHYLAASPVDGSPRALPRDRAHFWDALDLQSAAVRLNIANERLWDQYDRLNAEAEFRLTLVYPMLLVAAGIAARGAWWGGLLVVLLAGILFRDGDRRGRAANNVLVTALVTDVIEDPGLAQFAAATYERLRNTYPAIESPESQSLIGHEPGNTVRDL